MVATVATMTSALVLGGGGVTGVAWEIGLLHGLDCAGVSLSSADAVIGTSAGSVVGTLLRSGRPLSQLYDGQLAPPTSEIAATFGASVMARWVLAQLLPGSGQVKRRRIGQGALKAHPEPPTERLQVISRRLEMSEWPPGVLLVTAVDATTGAFRVFDKDSGVDIVDAVAASCAVPFVWPPVRVGGVPHVDGGVRSATNADLAQGADRVVVVAPITRAFSKATSPAGQLQRLGPGVRSVVISPDAASRAAIGNNPLDPARRAGAARAGFDQAASVAEEVRAVWEG